MSAARDRDVRRRSSGEDRPHRPRERVDGAERDGKHAADDRPARHRAVAKGRDRRRHIGVSGGRGDIGQDRRERDSQQRTRVPHDRPHARPPHETVHDHHAVKSETHDGEAGNGGRHGGSMDAQTKPEYEQGIKRHVDHGSGQRDVHGPPSVAHGTQHRGRCHAGREQREGRHENPEIAGREIVRPASGPEHGEQPRRRDPHGGARRRRDEEGHRVRAHR